MLDKNREEPIIFFEDEDDLRKCAKEWIDILFLNDWVINVNLIDHVPASSNAGENEVQFVNKYALINIYTPTKSDTEDMIAKFSQEHVLVHELLHCKYNKIFNTDFDSYEKYILNLEQHALLEQLAKSLIMARYQLTFDYFKN